MRRSRILAVGIAMLAGAALASCAAPDGATQAGATQAGATQAGATQAGAGACGGPPQAAGPDGCALVCRAVLPIRFVDGTPRTMVWVNDQPVELVVDTGASVTVLTPAAAAALGLGAPRPAPGEVRGIGGARGRRVVDTRGLAFGDIAIGPRPVDIAEFGPSPTPPMGSLGNDILRDFEIDLDLPRNTVRLYEGRACPGLPPGWVTAGRAIAFDPGFAGTRPVVLARLDGAPMRAMIDSGTASSAVDGAFARGGLATDPEPTELAAPSVGVGTRVSIGRRRLFRRLQIGAEDINDFETDVMDLRPLGVDALLGGDILRRRQVWLSAARREMIIGGAW